MIADQQYSFRFGHDLCANLPFSERREWLVTNGLGSYASGTVAGLLTRGYHGLLVAALNPPAGRYLVCAKLDETIGYRGTEYELSTNRWRGGTVAPAGHNHIDRFWMDGSIPTWSFGLADAIIQKRIWMEPGADTTYVSYTLLNASHPVQITARVIVNLRSYHDHTTGGNDVFSSVQTTAVPQGLSVKLTRNGHPNADLLLLSNSAQGTPAAEWFNGFDLARERDRGLRDWDDHFHVATFRGELKPDQPVVFAVSAAKEASPDVSALDRRMEYDRKIVEHWAATRPPERRNLPSWARQALLAADQFLVARNIPGETQAGNTVIAGYHWFADWGRDTMISLPGLTIATGRAEVAKRILETFAGFVSQGLLPNNFPDSPGAKLEYNTVDATLWYFQAVWTYYDATKEREFIEKLYPVLVDIVEWHSRGTYFNIRVDPSDGLLSAGEEGWQLTWMDAKVNGKVITPRRGKPVEVNALWYNALHVLTAISKILGRDGSSYESMAEKVCISFQRFWNADRNCCFDVVDGPQGNENHIRPNQLFAISLPHATLGARRLLAPEQEKAVLDVCEARLLAFTGMRSLDPADPDFIGLYNGNQEQRDSAYHQGVVWAWLKGAFIEAHLRVNGDIRRAEQLLEPLIDSMVAECLGTVGEIFEGAAAMEPRGCVAQAWSVAELLRIWTLIENAKAQTQPA